MCGIIAVVVDGRCLVVWCLGSCDGQYDGVYDRIM